MYVCVAADWFCAACACAAEAAAAELAAAWDDAAAACDTLASLAAFCAAAIEDYSASELALADDTASELALADEEAAAELASSAASFWAAKSAFLCNVFLAVPSA